MTSDDKWLLDVLLQGPSSGKDLVRQCLLQGPYADGFDALIRLLGDVPDLPSAREATRTYAAELPHADLNTMTVLVDAGFATPEHAPTEAGIHAVALLYLCPIGLS